jgi:drug/metabolite transporter (DMT)-like permease
MIWSLLGALAASVCFGVATVLEAMAARAVSVVEGVDPRLLFRLARRWPFVVGILLDLVGFGAELAALRSLPLFVVQAVIAANLAVTAVLSARVLKIRLTTAEWAGVASVCAGLALLGLASGREQPAHVGTEWKLSLVGGVMVLLAAGITAGRLQSRARGVALGLVAGIGFAIVAISARVLTSLAPLDLLADPAAYALAGGGTAAMLFYATALQRGSATTTTAAVVVAETVIPATVGVWLLGDQTRHGYIPAAGAGFVLAVAGALTLARFGAPPIDQNPTQLRDDD